MSSLSLLEAKIIPKIRTEAIIVKIVFLWLLWWLRIGSGALVVGGGIICGDWGVLALVLDFKQVILTSSPELAHCGAPPPHSGPAGLHNFQRQKI